MANITTNEDMNICTNWFHPSQRNSTNNDYLNLINDILVGQYKAGAYVADWSGVSLPNAPSHGKWCIRVNTDASNAMRLYSYNGESSTWQYIAFN